LVSLFYKQILLALYPDASRFLETSSREIIAPGTDLVAVTIGASTKNKGSLAIQDFYQDEAVVVLFRAFHAEDYPFLKVNLSGLSPFIKAKLIWRKRDSTDIESLSLPRLGNAVSQISMISAGSAYSGEIESIGLLFYDGPEVLIPSIAHETIVVRNITFLPFSFKNVALQLVSDWTSPPLLTGSANNFVAGAARSPLISPNLATYALLALSALGLIIKTALSKAKTGSSALRQTLITLIFLWVISWIILDTLRWVWRFNLTADSLERYAGIPIEDRVRRNEVRCARFPTDCASRFLPYF
jgi:hypothetical protein